MSGMERIYQIDQILAGRKFVPRVELQERLGVSWATLKRDLNYLKDRLNAPIIFDRDLGGYRFETESKRVGPQYELPGLWFSAEEIHALLTMQHLLANLDTGGLLGPHIKPLLSRLTALMARHGHRPDALLLTRERFNSSNRPFQGAVLLDGSNQGSIHYAQCCRPVPGDPIVGYLGSGEGLIVHHAQCKIAQRLQEKDRDRFIVVEWADDMDAGRVRHRLATYHTQTEPLIEHYQRLGKCCHVEGATGVETTFKQIKECLNPIL